LKKKTLERLDSQFSFRVGKTIRDSLFSSIDKLKTFKIQKASR